MTAKHFVPDKTLRIELRNKRKRLSSNSLPHVQLTEREIADMIKGKMKFYSLSLRKPNPDSFASTFIVATTKPLKWRDFIIRVSLALEDLI